MSQHLLGWKMPGRPQAPGMQPEPAPMHDNPQPWPLRGPQGSRQSSVRPIRRSVLGTTQRSGVQHGSQQRRQMPQPPQSGDCSYPAHNSADAGRITDGERVEAQLLHETWAWAIAGMAAIKAAAKSILAFTVPSWVEFSQWPTQTE